MDVRVDTGIVVSTRPDRVLIYSTRRRWTVLRLDPEEWAEFLDDVKQGVYDGPDISGRVDEAVNDPDVGDDVRPADDDLSAAESPAV
jgi:hypothetical protein